MVTHGGENIDFLLIILTTIRKTKTKINASRERVGTLWFNFLLTEGREIKGLIKGCFYELWRKKLLNAF